MSGGRQVVLPSGRRGVLPGGRVGVTDDASACPSCCEEIEACQCRCPDAWPESGCGLKYGRRGSSFDCPFPPFDFGIASISAAAVWRSGSKEVELQATASNIAVPLTSVTCARLADGGSSGSRDTIIGVVEIEALCSGDLRMDCPDATVQFTGEWRSEGAQQYLDVRVVTPQACIVEDSSFCGGAGIGARAFATFISGFGDSGGECFGNPGGSSIEKCDVSTSGGCKTSMTATMVWERPELGSSFPFRRNEITISLDVTYPIGLCSEEEFEL